MSPDLIVGIIIGAVPAVVVGIMYGYAAGRGELRRRRDSGHAATVITVGAHNKALACACGSVFPVRRGEDPAQCPEWHAHVTIAHLREQSEARRG